MAANNIAPCRPPATSAATTLGQGQVVGQELHALAYARCQKNYAHRWPSTHVPHKHVSGRAAVLVCTHAWLPMAMPGCSNLRRRFLSFRCAPPLAYTLICVHACARASARTVRYVFKQLAPCGQGLVAKQSVRTSVDIYIKHGRAHLHTESVGVVVDGLRAVLPHAQHRKRERLWQLLGRVRRRLAGQLRHLRLDEGLL